MARLLLIVCAFLTMTAAPVVAQSGGADPSQNLPPARLIKPRSGKTEPHQIERLRSRAGPVDERCKALKQELETELQEHGNVHKTFQARLAHNAGTRLCREGQAEKGMAEFRKGLSYLEEKHYPQ